MLTNPAPSPPPVVTNLDPVTPQSPSRSSRLRRLTYLRSYTQQHLSSSNSPSRTSRPNFSRSSSYPAGDTTLTTATTTNPGPEGGRLQRGNEAATAESHSTSSSRPSSGWLPTVGSLSGISRPTQSQTSTSDSPTAVGESASATNPESLESENMAKRRTNPTSRPARSPAPEYSPEAMRFARLDGPPNLDPGPPMPASYPTEDSSMTTTARESPKVPSITFLPHQDPRSSRPSLVFPPVSRILKYESSVIRVGRYSERETIIHSGPNEVDAAPVGFKSKVVSRKHCEFWFANGKWWLKDVKSSSGTFLNHIRLSPANQESKPFQVNDGDVIQLGIDFRGGEEQIFRCVKIKVESNRTWQKKLNQFNVQTHKQLRALGKTNSREEDGTTSQSTECVICLMSIAPCQSLFVAPCSHVWHYKCIRPILDSKSYPQFVCPNCRAVADLEADVDVPEDSAEMWDDAEEPSDANSLDQPNSLDQNGDVAMANGVQEDASPPSTATATRGSDDSGVVMNDAPPASLVSPEAAEAEQLNVSPSSLISRRQASNGSLLRAEGAGAVTAIDLPAPTAPVNVPSTSNSTTSGDRDTDGVEANPEDRTRLRSPTPQSSEQLTADGLLTPTNNAGPFVFDGSAGRSSGGGRRLTATAEAISGSAS